MDQAPTAAFTPFPRLPVELRLKIWEMGVGSRTVHIEWSRQRRQCVSPDVPDVLHVSREAREEGLKTLQLAFNTGTEAPIYFDFERDAACFQWQSFGRRPGEHVMMLKEDCRRIKYMVMDASVRLSDGLELVNFESLKELQVVGCANQVSDVIGDDPLVECAFRPWVRSILPGKKMYTVPMLRCVDQGVRCRDHWWFEAWNEKCARGAGAAKEVCCWQVMFTVVNDLAHGCLQDREAQGRSVRGHTCN